MVTRRSFLALCLVGALVLPLLLGCGAASTPTSASAPTTAATVAATKAPPAQATSTKAPPMGTAVPATPKATGPTVGGKLVWALGAEPDTLDPQLTTAGVSGMVISQIGASLVTQDPVTGKVLPYLAESWKMSPDGLVWDFKLRKDVKFHDGTPLTAADYAWTFQRAIAPETKSAVVGLIPELVSAMAVDDYTLRLTLNAPSAPFMINLCYESMFPPLSKAQVEKLGVNFGRAPISVGPFKVKEWVTGMRIVLERNPDFKWYPPYIKSGPFVDAIEYRIIPEEATTEAGIEAGEVDVSAELSVEAAQRLVDAKKAVFLETPQTGSGLILFFNLSKPPLDDLRVRKAINWGIDKEAMVRVITLGDGVAMHGPASSATAGYWPGVEQFGYGFDVAKAQALLKEAGYTLGASGIFEKGGQPLKLQLICGAMNKTVKTATMVKENLKAIGVDVDINSADWPSQLKKVLAGEYEFCIFNWGSSDIDYLATLFGSAKINGSNIARVGSVEQAKLDELFLAERTQVDPDKRLEACVAVQKYLVENAYQAPMYVSTNPLVVSNRLGGVVVSNFGSTWPMGAYVKK
jgi:peptide/nickel transport system substrate-binding protein